MSYQPTAFPTPEFHGQKLIGPTPGLSKREFFAALAMQALLSRGMVDPEFAYRAVAAADMLMSALNKPSGIPNQGDTDDSDEPDDEPDIDDGIYSNGFEEPYALDDSPF